MPKTFFGGQLYCPKCGSKNVEVVSSSDRHYSLGKGILGGAVFGPVGMVAGINGKKGKGTCHCLDCGKVWHEKL